MLPQELGQRIQRGVLVPVGPQQQVSLEFAGPVPGKSLQPRGKYACRQRSRRRAPAKGLVTGLGTFGQVDEGLFRRRKILAKQGADTALLPPSPLEDGRQFKKELDGEHQ